MVSIRERAVPGVPSKYPHYSNNAVSLHSVIFHADEEHYYGYPAHWAASESNLYVHLLFVFLDLY